jgi:hypothetical protein
MDEQLEIEFCPVPDRFVQKHKGLKWESLLNPVRAVPGSPARIKVCSTDGVAKIEVKRIKDRMREVREMERWEFNIRPLRDQSDRYGIWATFRGIYTVAEYQDELIRRKAARDRGIRAGAKRRARKALQEPMSNVSLLRPNPGRG